MSIGISHSHQDPTPQMKQFIGSSQPNYYWLASGPKWTSQLTIGISHDHLHAPLPSPPTVSTWKLNQNYSLLTWEYKYSKLSLHNSHIHSVNQAASQVLYRQSITQKIPEASNKISSISANKDFFTFHILLARRHLQPTTLLNACLCLNTKSSSYLNSPHFQALYSYILTHTFHYITFFSCKSNTKNFFSSSTFCLEFIFKTYQIVSPSFLFYEFLVIIWPAIFHFYGIIFVYKTYVFIN